jgi:hypothetical protein
METGLPEPMEFVSPTGGRLTFDQMFQRLVAFVDEEPYQTYRLIIGTDSLHGQDTSFVTAIVIHRVGHGGRYFYKKLFQRKMESLRQRIFYETSMSLEIATRITAALESSNLSDLPVEIHLDVGEAGETRRVIREVVGMVTGSGFEAKTKPDAYGASKVADHHT